MNILHVIPDLALTTGGPVTAIIGLANAQSSPGRNITIITSTLGADVGMLAPNITVHAFRATKNPWRFGLGLTPLLKTHLQNADIVHIHTMWAYSTFEAARQARLAKRPYVLEPAGMLATWSLDQKALKKAVYLRTIDRCTLRHAAGIRGSSKRDLNDPRVASIADKGFIIPHGVAPCGTANADHFLEARPWLRGRRLILFMGRIHPKKQPNLLIEALPIVQAKIPDAHLVIVGSGDPDYVKSLSASAESLGVTASVTFTGALSPTEVRDSLRAASVFVLPSHHENFGLAAAEAISEGCPAILSPGVDIAHEIRSAGACIIAPATAKDIAAAVTAICSDPSLSKTLAEKGRAYAEQHFEWRAVADRLVRVYYDILRGERSSVDWLSNQRR